MGKTGLFGPAIVAALVAATPQAEQTVAEQCMAESLGVLCPPLAPPPFDMRETEPERAMRSGTVATASSSAAPALPLGTAAANAWPFQPEQSWVPLNGRIARDLLLLDFGSTPPPHSSVGV